jgi:SAM-dependent methyltransferase
MDYDIDADFPALPDRLLQRRCTQCGLHWFLPSPVGPARLYETLERWPAYYRPHAWEWDESLAILLRHGIEECLEVGAGTGGFLEQAGRVLKHCEGIEFNAAAVRTAQARGLHVSNTPLEAVADRRPAIVAHQLLEHLESPGAFFRTCVAKLRVGGLLIVAVPNQDGFIGPLDANYLNRPPHHATLWRKSSFQAAADRFGLNLIDYRTAPLALDQYRIYLLRNARPSPSLTGKLFNFLRRGAIGIAAPLMIPFARRTLPGEAHLAVFRKVAG